MTWTSFFRRPPAPVVGAAVEQAPRMSEHDAKTMVESLVSAATGAAMLNLPPTIYVEMALNLERQKAKVMAALMTQNVKE